MKIWLREKNVFFLSNLYNFLTLLIVLNSGFNADFMIPMYVLIFFTYFENVLKFWALKLLTPNVIPFKKLRPPLFTYPFSLGTPPPFQRAGSAPA